MLAKGQQRGSPQIQPWTVPQPIGRLIKSDLLRQSPMKTKCRIFAVLFLGAAYSVGAAAAPNEIDIAGIIPGKSTKQQVEALKNGWGYVIGGYRLLCVPGYDQETLIEMLCLTGDFGATYGLKDMQSEDAASGSKASNFEIHKEFLKGYTKKFGPPSSVENEKLGNRFGAVATRNTVSWIDQKGNELTITSITERLNEGALLLRSKAKILDDQTQKQSKDQQRKF